MEKKNIISTVGIVLLLALAVFCAVTYERLTSVRIVGLDLSDVRDITTKSFDIDGVIYLDNPSGVDAKVKNVDYDIVLASSEDVLASGSVPSFTLAKKSTTNTTFTQEVAWSPTADLALELISKDHVLVILRGTVTLEYFIIGEVNIDFEKKKDIKPYVSSYVLDVLS
jgi:hypothetical protein